MNERRTLAATLSSSRMSGPWANALACTNETSAAPLQRSARDRRVWISTMPPVARPYETSNPPGRSSIESIISTGSTAVRLPKCIVCGTGTPLTR